MGEPKPEWPMIQLCKANQQRIIPLGWLPQVVVSIKGVNVKADFEVIKIMDDTYPYPALLGLDWAFDMDGVIDLKKKRMDFEYNGVQVIIPLDLVDGHQYTEPMRIEDGTTKIYNLSLREEDWLNPRAYGSLKWEKDNFCSSDSNEELDNW